MYRVPFKVVYPGVALVEAKSAEEAAGKVAQWPKTLGVISDYAEMDDKDDYDQDMTPEVVFGRVRRAARGERL